MQRRAQTCGRRLTFGTVSTDAALASLASPAGSGRTFDPSPRCGGLIIHKESHEQALSQAAGAGDRPDAVIRRRGRHGQQRLQRQGTRHQGQPLRQPQPVRQRQVDCDASDPGRQDALGCVRRAVREEPRHPARHHRSRGQGSRDRQARHDQAAAGRFLPQRHERGGDRQGRLHAAAAAAQRDRRDQEYARSGQLHRPEFRQG